MTEVEIDASNAYGVAVRAYGGALTAPKKHSIEDRCPRFMRTYKALYLFTEEGDEACHHEVKEASVQTRSMCDPKDKAMATLRIFERRQCTVEIRKARRSRITSGSEDESS